MSEVPEPPSDGPDGHLNWRCADLGFEENDAVEFALYSDARLVGHAGFGPYEVINTIPTDQQDRMPMAAVLRMRWHVPERDPLPDMSKSDQTTFHGGGVGDEMAALLSLALGVRLQAAGVIREFKADGDPWGRPVQHSHRRPAPPEGRQTSIPSLRGGDLRILVEALAIYPRLDPAKATEVVRAARSYQQGVWMSDADPEYAWLKFVSALETGANCWWRGDDDPETALRNSKPELAKVLSRQGDAALVRDVGELLRDQLRATHRFYAFTERYRPPPPEIRPRFDQVPWDDLGKAMRVIYKHRSKSLHAGVPFPVPMLDEPRVLDEGQPPIERPLGLAAAAGSTVWQKDELPMLLHIFEYITRETLLAWIHDENEGPVIATE